MLTIKEIKSNNRNECNSCGKVRKRCYEIRYGIPLIGEPWQPYSILPICRSCLRKLHSCIERKLPDLSKAVNQDE